MATPHELTKAYGGRTVVRGVSLDVELRRGRRPARAERRRQDHDLLHDGRTVRARLAAASLLDGDDVTDDPMYVRARKGIGYLPQEPSIFRGLTVEQNIMAILETLPLSAAERRAAAGGAARRAGPRAPRASRRPTRCRAASGGGPRSRRALVMSPRFILLDEPFAGIDPIAVTDIQEIIFHLQGARHRRADHRPQRARNAAASPIARTSSPTGRSSAAAPRPSWPPTRKCGGFTSGTDFPSGLRWQDCRAARSAKAGRRSTSWPFTRSSRRSSRRSSS